MRHRWRMCICLLFAAGCAAQNATPPRALSWQETQAHFRANNPTLLAGQSAIAESQADEITAFLRPNPDLSLGWDQITPFSGNPYYRPFSNSYVFGDLTYLHERRHKRELRQASAREETAITISTQNDVERNLMFSLRDAFVRVLLAKAVANLANENLAYYDKEIDINRQRYEAGDLAHVDLQRVELQRIQYESDIATAAVNIRTAKIDLLALLHDQTAVDQFDVSEPFDFSDPTSSTTYLEKLAIDVRPDLKQAIQALEKARTDHQLAVANGSTDPTFGIDGSHQPPPLNTYIGFSLNIPLRIFDRNQGEKIKTQIDITRNERLVNAAQTTVVHDVDSAYATMRSTLQLLGPYKSKYLKEAAEVRDTVSFSYQHGAASLIDFLDAQKSYRDIELNYLNLVGAYLSAANQVNFAVGREVIR